MNWNTKAKTRIGGGRNKGDIENQQRLAAWNKTPKGNKRSADNLAENQQGKKVLTMENVLKSGLEFHTSGDLLMLGDTQEYLKAAYVSSDKSASALNAKKRFGRPPSVGTALLENISVDPLALLQLSPAEEHTGRAASLMSLRLASNFDGSTRCTSERSIYEDELYPAVATDAITTRVIFFNNGCLCHELTGLPIWNNDNVTDKGTVKEKGASQKNALRSHGVNVPCRSQKCTLDPTLLPYSSGSQDCARDKWITDEERDEHLTKSETSSHDTLIIDEGLTMDNWWSRFVLLVKCTALAKSRDIDLFLSEFIEISNTGIGSSATSLKSILLTLYRTLNQLSRTNGQSSKFMSTDEIIALCDAIRLLEFADKQFSSNCNSNAINITVRDVRQSDQSHSISLGEDNRRQDLAACYENSKARRNTDWNIFGGAIQFNKSPKKLRIEKQITSKSSSEVQSNRKNLDTVLSQVMTTSITGDKVRHGVSSMESPVDFKRTTNIEDHFHDDYEYLEAEVFL